eukprot:UN32945
MNYVVKVKQRQQVEKSTRRVSDDRPANEKLIQQWLNRLEKTNLVMPLKEFAICQNQFYYFMAEGKFEVFDYVAEHWPTFTQGWKKHLLKQKPNYHKKNPSPWEKKMRAWFKKMCKSVKYMHENDMVHRDLKLENFILIELKNGKNQSDFTPKMIDFGLARRFPSCNTSYAMINACGTPGYRAPEIFYHGEPRQDREYDVSHYDGRLHDSWTLGICLYMMMFRRNPWSKPSNSDPKFYV